MLGGADLYIFQMAVTGDFKVGRSSNVRRRIAEIQTSCPHPLRMILHIPGAGHLERDVHAELRKHQTRVRNGEWFYETGLGDLPTPIYDRIPLDVLEDPDWWKKDW